MAKFSSGPRVPWVAACPEMSRLAALMGEREATREPATTDLMHRDGHGLLYRLPAPGDEDMLGGYVKEHLDAGEERISASMGLASSDPSDWIARMAERALVGDGEWGRSIEYLCIGDGRLVGLLSVRPELPDDLACLIGHIGYGVRPSARERGHATAMLAVGLSVCSESGMTEALVACHTDNVASRLVIRRNGGVPIATTEYRGKESQVCRITL